MIASLPMYDRAETAAANDRLWAAMRDILSDWVPEVPAALTRSADPWDDWRSDELLFSQTCSLPYKTKLNQRLCIVGSPVSDLDCPPGHYFSVLVKHRDDPRSELAEFDGCTFALNDELSQSGWAAALTAFQAAGISPGETPLTGAHVKSALVVAEGRADLAALDAVTWGMIRMWDAFAPGLAVLSTTPSTPALPFVTAMPDLTDLLFGAFETAIGALSQADQDVLNLRGLIKLPEKAYEPA